MGQNDNMLMLSGDLMADWHLSLAQIIEGGIEDSALSDLLSALEQLVAAESSSVIVYPRSRTPYSVCHRLLKNESPAIHIDQYLDGAYVVDPCYLFAREQGVEGFYTTMEISPEGFKDSEYYKIYYGEIDLHDEAFFAVKGVGGTITLVSLGRHSYADVFSTEDKTLLKAIFPIVKAIVNEWMSVQSAQTPETAIERELDLALENFGNSLLTPKESSILHLLLRGHAIKVIAANLDNSVETIKHHRKNIYLKLDISSQAELFHLFIDSLRSYVPAPDKDPLVAYMSISG